MFTSLLLIEQAASLEQLVSTLPLVNSVAKTQAAYLPSSGLSSPLAHSPQVSSSRLPASFGQRQLCIVQDLLPNKAAYNISLMARLRGPLNVTWLKQAVQAVVARHEVLRTTFRFNDGDYEQVIHSTDNMTFVEEIDLASKVWMNIVVFCSFLCYSL
jgi:hypothetical protein